MKTTFLNFATALVLTSALIQTANAKAGDYNVITEAKKYIQNPRVEVECQGYGYDSYDINYFSYAILNEVELYGDPKKPLPVLGINRLLVEIGRAHV